jgi:hypothetical protein
MVLWEYSGLGGNSPMKKTRSKATVPLSQISDFFAIFCWVVRVFTFGHTFYIVVMDETKFCKCIIKKLLLLLKNLVENSLKGTVSRDFLLLVFFMNQFPPNPRVFHLDRYEFLEIFASQGAPPVANNGNNIRLQTP